MSLLSPGLCLWPGARAQGRRGQGRGAAPPAAKAEVPPKPANLDQVLATVNGEKITRGDLLNFLSRYQVPQASPEQIYHDAIESLINARLLGQFLARQQIAVPPEKVNEAIAQIESNLKANGRGDLQTLLQQSGRTMDDVRRQVTWDEYVKLKATDAELKKFVANHKDLVNSTLIKASHIYLNVPVDATAADKEKIRQQLLAIKQDIADKKTSFAAAANKFSQDPANAEGSGGDIGYFGLRTGIIPEFADAAFALKPGEISDPVETIHGLHLIEVTDRKEGTPVDFEQHKEESSSFTRPTCTSRSWRPSGKARRRSMPSTSSRCRRTSSRPLRRRPPLPPLPPPRRRHQAATRRLRAGSVPGAKP